MSLNTITPLTEYVFKVASIDEMVIGESNSALSITLEYQNPDSLTLANQNYEFIQTEELTEAGVAVQPYGAIIMNSLAPTQLSSANTAVLAIKTPGGILESDTTLEELELGATVTFAASEAEGGGGDEGGGDEGGGGATYPPYL